MDENTPKEEPVKINEDHWNGEQRLNQSTGEVEVYYNGMWCAR